MCIRDSLRPKAVELLIKGRKIKIIKNRQKHTDLIYLLIKMIRNALFSIFFFVGIIIISIIFLPALLLPRKITLLGGKLMGHWAGFCLRVFLSVKISIKGKENIITDQKFFIAASHQSMFETFYIQTVFN